MQKHLRAGINDIGRLTCKRTVHAEALNPYCGYFYTVKKVSARRHTRYQSIQLLDTDQFGKVLLLDDITQLGDKCDSHYHEPMVHPAFCSHPNPATVLVIGGGDGGILREVLRYPCVKRVEVAELDEGVIAFSRKYLPRVHGGAFRDCRVHINVTDGRLFVENHPGEFDVVIMDMTDPAGPSAFLYTREFFKAVTRSFRTPKGIFMMHTESPVSRPEAFSCIQKTLRTSFACVTPFYLYIPMYATLWSITLCSPTINSSRLTATAIDRKLSHYGISRLEVYSGATHVAMQTSFPYVTRLLRHPVRLITDAEPRFPDDLHPHDLYRK
ncbi:MAG: polyamine aminopropyltransferase [Chitinispirillaceae bacterium]|jgi:spermidine synthase